MIDWVFHLLDVIDIQLGHPTAVRALIVGFVCSVGLTQLLKNLPNLDAFTDGGFRWAVRVLAFGLGAVPTWALWPEAGVSGIAMAIVIGIVSPLLYTVLVRTAVHFWPWIDVTVSARPQTKED